MPQQESRVKKSLLNARVNLIFYFLTLVLSFFSRKIFLDTLGADFVGLTGTLQNILGFLNLAEFGIGTAVSFNLYKPLRYGNKMKINELISLFGFFYRRVGSVVIVVGVIISLFIPIIFKNTIFEYGIIFFAFYSFLISNLLGYFINYKQILLNADQKNYVVAAYFQIGNIIKTIIQLFIAYYLNNYYIWIFIELCFSVIYSFILNWKIKKIYPYLQTQINQGNSINKKYPQVLQSTKQVFIHKIKDFLLTQTDQIFIFAFVSLKMVAFYGNYTLIISKITQLFTTTFDSIGASVGNLVAEGNKSRMLNVFWELMAVRYFMAGIIVFSLYYLTTPFISLWLGSEYILDHKILVLLLINTFIMLTRGTVDVFNNAYGHYGDTWSAWVEGIINVSVTLSAGYLYGIIGIILGKIISTFFIVILWKPYYLFSQGFEMSYKYYWRDTIKYYIIFLVAAVILSLEINFVNIDYGSNYYNLTLYSVIIVSSFALVYFFLLYMFSNGMKSLVHRVLNKNKYYGKKIVNNNHKF